MKTKRNNSGLMATTTLYGALFAALAFGGVAHAQTTTADTEAAAKAKKAEEKKPEVTEVTVVGSRIRKDTFNSASPITVITREETTLEGLTSTAAVLQGTSSTGGAAQINNAYGGYVVNGGGGVNTLSLRGLGAGRTLILINGRRVSPAGTRGSLAAADLNVLPNALINRIDILRDGASAIYGSDAIGGVVNIVTRSVDGVQMEVMGASPVHGGGNQMRASIVAGQHDDHFYIQGSAEYYQQDNLTLAQRDWTRCNTDYRFNPTTGVTTDYIDPLTGQSKCYPITSTGSNGVTINTLGTPNFTGVGATNATGTTFNRWRPNSSITTGLVGFEGVGGGTTTNTNIRDTFDPRTLNQSLISPSNIVTAFGQAGYKFHDSTDSELYTELLVNHRASSQTGYRQLSLDYPTGSTLIPTAISSIPGNFLAAGGSVLSTGAIKARAFIGFGNYKTRESDAYMKGVIGMRGNLPWLADWQYDVYVSTSKSDATYTFDTWLTDRLANSLNTTTTIGAGVTAAEIKKDAAGNNVTCVVNNTSAGAAGCVPAPVLNSATIGGVLPQDWINYTWTAVTGRTTYNETTFSANINGPIFTLPAGALQGAFGVEMRKADIDDEPSLDSINSNLYNLTSSGVTKGSDEVKEAYAELEVPVLKDLPLAKTLNLELAGRYTDYKSYGGQSTYKSGIVWSPADFITFRASKGTSFRAPALYEQFLGATTGFLSNSGDPCNNWDAPGVTATRKANCQAENLPAGFTNTSSITVITQGGAANHLKAETSDNTTVGFIFKPTFLPKSLGDFGLAVDAFNVQVANGVSNLSAAQLLSLCYDDPGFRTSSAYCSFIVRNATTHNLTVTAGYTNVSRQGTKGYDYDLRWNRKFNKLGVLIDLSVTENTAQTAQTLPTSVNFNYNGTLQYPKFSGTLDGRFTYEKWTGHYGVEFISKMNSYAYEGLDPKTTTFTLGTPDYYLQNVSVEYKGTGYVATFGVRNLADVQPPKISSGYYNRVGNALLYSGYDYLGRQVFFNVSKKF